MRPRSRLLSKRRLLLPTITEGTEESLKDLNEAHARHNTGHSKSVSSEDYFLSICHLAHPTFPTSDVSPCNEHSGQVDQRVRLSRSPSGNFQLYHTDRKTGDMKQHGEKELDASLMFGNFDPLEYIYGHQNLSGGVVVEGRFIKPNEVLWEGQARSRAHSIPRASSPDLSRQRKSSSPELHTSTDTSFPKSSPKHRTAKSNTRKGDKGGQNPNKQSLISQWISDCRSAWREARARACMLPAIAEVWDGTVT